MDKQIQFFQLTPTEFLDAINNSVNIKLEELKNSINGNVREELLTRSETAEMLKINLSTLWAWTKSNKLTSYSIGNRIYYKHSEVMESIIELKN